MHIVDLLKLIFIAIGTFFGIFGILADKPFVQEHDQQGVPARRSWARLSKKARISLVSLVIGFLGTFITTHVSQREERKREVRRKEQQRIEEQNVRYGINALDSISSRLLIVQQATDQLVYPIDSAILSFTVEYTLSELPPEALRELERFAAEEAGKWMWDPSSHESLAAMLHDYPLINEHLFDYEFALCASSTQSMNALNDGDHLFTMSNRYFGECIREAVDMDEEKLSIRLSYRPHVEKGTQALAFGTSASALAGKHIYFFLRPGRKDLDHTGYTFRIAENTVRLGSWRAGFTITIPMDPVAQKLGGTHDQPYRYQAQMPQSPLEFIKPYQW